MTQPVRAIALEWNTPALVEVLAALSTDYGWEPVYCVGARQQGRLSQIFPAAIYHETHDARYARPPQNLADLQPAALDQPTAEAIGYAQVMALKQMDRMELLGGFALHDRILHFHRLAGYWTAVLDHFAPDVLIMPTSPHVVYDYVAYTLAKRRGIPAVMFEYIASDGLLAAIDGFEDGIPDIQAEYRRLRASRADAPVDLSERMETYWKSVRGSYGEAMPYWTRAVTANALAFEQAQAEARAGEEERTKRWLSLVAVPRRLPATALRVVRRLRRLGSAPSPPPKALTPQPPATDGHYQGAFYSEQETPAELARAAAEHRRRHVESVRRRYDELAGDPDVGLPYVYVALHGQPERATNPNGGVFDDQDVMIRMITSALPSGWRVYVKEHPAQFMPHFASERGRWSSFYDALLTDPAVSLISRSTPSFTLIDHARAVASLTGTSSWEAIARGVPALVFGEPWYKGCDGAHTVRTLNDCRQALSRIAAGERPDPNAVRLFLLAAERVSVRGYLSSDDEPIAGVDPNANAAGLAQAIDRCFRASAKRDR